jgi:uncharacterized delta-60 repeat protein
MPVAIPWGSPMRIPSVAKSRGLVSLLLSLVWGAPVHAAPGDLDPTFAGTGRVRLGFGNGDGVVQAAALQLDGKCLLAGYTIVGSHREFSIARSNTDGSPDLTFGASGNVMTAFTPWQDDLHPGWDVPTAIRIQGTDKFVVSGYGGVASLNGLHFVVARYFLDGTLDSSFGVGGKVLTDLGFGEAYGMVIQNDGRILVVGKSYTSSPGPHFEVALVRYNSDGTLDTSFSGGIVKTSVGIGDAQARSAIVLPDGHIIVVGSASVSAGDDDILVMRYNTNGSRDLSFGGGDGIITINAGSNFEVANVVGLQTSNTSPTKILVAGKREVGTIVLRLNLDGTPDSAFGGTGIVLTPIGTTSEAVALALQFSAGNPSRIVVAATSWDGVTSRFAVARYLLNGALDATLDGDGILTTAIGSVADARAVFLPSGKILVAGASFSQTDGSEYTTARYNSDGSLDTSYDGDGLRSDRVGNAFATANATALQTDGKLVVVGTTYCGNVQDNCIGIMRLNADGSLDSSFDGDGLVTTTIGPAKCEGNAVAIQTDGKIVVAGTSSEANGASSDLAVARYNVNGSLDSSFDGDGKVQVSIDAFNEGKAVKIQADGKIVVGGFTSDGVNEDFALVRLNANGSLDTAFHGDGIVTTDFGSLFDEANAMAIQSDGRIVLAGSMHNGLNKDFAVARYNADGSFDGAFNGVGRLTTRVGGGNDVARAVVIQPNGRIVVAGETVVGGIVPTALVIVRYSANGTLDATFDGDGKAITGIDFGSSSANAVLLQTDGKILIAGQSAAYPEANHFVLARYESNGSLDAGYGFGGIVDVDALNGESDRGLGLVLDPNGRAIVVGNVGDLFGVMRLLGDASSTDAPVFTDAPTAGLTLAGANPFHDVTALSFDLAEDSSVSLRVYNVTGALVRVLVDGRRGVGAQRVSWDGAGEDRRPVAAGVYFVQLTAGGHTSHAKVVKVR